MRSKPNKKLIVKVLVIGSIMALLSYIFHPEVGQFGIMLNGQPIADPLVRFAAIPTFLAMTALTGLFVVMLLFGFGVLVFVGCLFVALMATVIIAPYFWPIAIIVFLIIVIAGASHSNIEPR